MTAQQAVVSARNAEAAVAWLVEHDETEAAETLREQIERTMLSALRRTNQIVDIAAYGAPRLGLMAGACLCVLCAVA